VPPKPKPISRSRLDSQIKSSAALKEPIWANPPESLKIGDGAFGGDD